jgi:hypothetical protein
VSGIILAVAILLDIFWAVTINYPPSIQQIDLGVSSPFSLWAIRILSLFLIAIATYLFASLLGKKNRLFYWIFIFISPAINIFWLAYPIDCLKVLLVSILAFLVLRKNLSLFLGLFLSVIFLIGINHFYLKQDLAIFSTLSLNRSQAEVMERISKEDPINPHINLPLWFRRIGYNKYFLTLQNTLKESIKFWDQESVFFQEVHPLEQKSVVIFYWPEVILLLVILWFYVAKLDSGLKKSLLVIMLFSWIYFVLTNDIPYKQLIMVLFWVSLLLACGTKFIIESKNNRWLIFILILATGYGIIANFSDRLKRPLFWLDNRPVVFQKLFENAKLYNYQKYSAVYLTNLIGPADKYCRYYLKNCQNFRFENFDLSLTPPQHNSIYLGYIGNFMGPKSDNIFSNQLFLDWAYKKQVNILNRFSIRDTVAFRYGNDLIVADKQ